MSRHAGPNALVEVRSELLPDTASTVTLRVRNSFVRGHEARNVWGVAPAKGKTKDWLLITAHYDHLGHMGPDVLFPGANDNASGVSMLLTLAEWFKAHPPKMNILFVAFAGEEAGLVGSEWFAVDRPMDLGAIKLVLNLDLNGTGEEGITVVNAVEQKAVFDQLVAINAKSQRLSQVKPRGPACNSDHCSFTKRGIPGIFIYTRDPPAHRVRGSGPEPDRAGARVEVMIVVRYSLFVVGCPLFGVKVPLRCTNNDARTTMT